MITIQTKKYIEYNIDMIVNYLDFIIMFVKL